jgi:hypothetical protein
MRLDTMLDAAIRTFQLADAVDAVCGGVGTCIYKPYKPCPKYYLLQPLSFSNTVFYTSTYVAV